MKSDPDHSQTLKDAGILVFGTEEQYHCSLPHVSNNKSWLVAYYRQSLMWATVE